MEGWVDEWGGELSSGDVARRPGMWVRLMDEEIKWLKIFR